MIASGQGMSDRFARTIPEEHTRVIAEHGIADCRLHTDTRRAAGHDQILDARALQSRVEVCFEEAAEAVLVYDHVLTRRRQFIDDVGIPRVSDQEAARMSVRRLNGSSHTEQLEMPRKIW